MSASRWSRKLPAVPEIVDDEALPDDEQPLEGSGPEASCVDRALVEEGWAISTPP